MLNFLVSVLVFSLGLLPLNNQSWHAYLAPYNLHAYENILQQTADQNDIVKMIFDCRLDPEKCLIPETEKHHLPQASATPSLIPHPPNFAFPTATPYSIPLPSAVPSIEAYWCGEFVACPEPDLPSFPPSPIATVLPTPNPHPTIPADTKPYPLPIPSQPPCGKNPCLPVEPPVIVGPPTFIDSVSPQTW